MARLVDHKVSRRTEAEISDLAYRWRCSAGINTSLYFNIVNFTKNELYLQLGRRIKICFLRQRFGESPAFIKFGRIIELNVDERVWRQAQIRSHEAHESARHILAHEIGHILLHKDQSKAFSNIPFALTFFEKEESAEWQANTFARHFLLVDRHVREHNCVDALVTLCGIPIQLAAEAIKTLRPARAIATGEFCRKCGGCSLQPNGAHSQCSDCGALNRSRTVLVAVSEN